ncbi:hypothetical protein LTR64_008062 [Lithohypha guttulata]|uniref:uncharacterized protein n=1 Tax=Lithohypha guttulata TaxID=1690604 RepID=UPI00315D875B
MDSTPSPITPVYDFIPFPDDGFVLEPSKGSDPNPHSAQNNASLPQSVLSSSYIFEYPGTIDYWKPSPAGNVYGDTALTGNATAILGNNYGGLHVQNATFLLQPKPTTWSDRPPRRVERHNTPYPNYTLETVTSFENGPNPSNQGSSYRTELYWQRQEDLGAGIFGEVHREESWNGLTCQSRAVKVLRLRQLQRLKVDYKKEVGALLQLSQPVYVRHFVELYAWYMDTSNVYLAMEYIAWGDLSNYIGPGLVEKDAKQIACQVLEGIKIMHRLDIVHRDIKPANIFVVQRYPTWWVKIGDFSICKSTTTQHTTLHTNVGTTGYQAPESLGSILLGLCGSSAPQTRTYPSSAHSYTIYLQRDQPRSRQAVSYSSGRKKVLLLVSSRLAFSDQNPDKA